jgi:hypothetical protein
MRPHPHRRADLLDPLGHNTCQMRKQHVQTMINPRWSMITEPLPTRYGGLAKTIGARLAPLMD